MSNVWSGRAEQPIVDQPPGSQGKGTRNEQPSDVELEHDGFVLRDLTTPRSKDCAGHRVEHQQAKKMDHSEVAQELRAHPRRKEQGNDRRCEHEPQVAPPNSLVERCSLPACEEHGAQHEGRQHRDKVKMDDVPVFHAQGRCLKELVEPRPVSSLWSRRIGGYPPFPRGPRADDRVSEAATSTAKR